MMDDESGEGSLTGEIQRLAAGRLNGVVGLRLRKLQLRLSREFAAQSPEPEIRPGTLTALALIEANPGVSQIEVAREMGVDGSVLVTLLRDLRKRELVDRRVSAQDRRRHDLEITPQGKAALDRLFSALLEAEQVVLSKIPQADLVTFVSVLERVITATASMEGNRTGTSEDAF